MPLIISFHKFDHVAFESVKLIERIVKKLHRGYAAFCVSRGAVAIFCV